MAESPRIQPLEPPYDPEIKATLVKWMPPNSGEPLALFRTLARHPMLLDRMRPLGAGLLGRGLLPARVRELLILRTSARCRATYEWSVHVTAFAQTAGLDRETVQMTATAAPEVLAVRRDDDALVFRVADELHDASTLSDELYGLLRERWGESEILEMVAVAGWYHLISFIIRAAGVADEPWAEPFPRA
jgi:alkylhydroperoxidase family enzyme